MTETQTPVTLLELAGADLAPPGLADAVVIVIDAQNEYTEGPLRLPDVDTAVTNAASLLNAARQSDAVVIHVAHRGKAGGLFDRDANRGQIIAAVSPQGSESVVEKGLPNGFADTTLQDEIAATGRKELVIAGFMTHMCVSSTARAALDLGYRISIDADSCATRSLPDGTGGTIDASTVHNVALAGLSDRFAVIVRNHHWT